MAPDAATQDRIYRALKQDLLAAVQRPDARIDIQTIADRQRASTTPVREALHRLMGERLVEPHPDGGFRLALPDVTQLLHLYVWNTQHLLSAIHIISRGALQQAILRPPATPGATPIELATAVATLFEDIGRATGNLEYICQIEAANERLTYPRIAEARFFADIPRELRTLTRPGDLSVQSSVRRRIIAYHRRRIEHVAQIANLLRVPAGSSI